MSKKIYLLAISHGKFDDGLALFDTHEVVVEEVDVEASLQDSRKDLGPAVEVIYVVAVDPVEDVEETIEAQSCDVVRGDVLN